MSHPYSEMITWYQAISTLLRNLNNIAIKMPRKESEKILKIIDQIEDLIHRPEKIRFKEDYEEEF